VEVRRGENRLGIAVGGRSRRQLDILGAALRLFAERGYRSTTMDDIAGLLEMRGPSLYKHVTSKQSLLAELMIGMMVQLQADHDAAVASTDDPVERLRRAVEAHVRYHARHRLEAFIGNRELANVEGADRSRLLALRRDYEGSFRRLVADGVERGVFRVRSVKLTSYAIVDLGIGVAVWFRDDGELSVEEVAYHHGDLALRLVGRSDPSPPLTLAAPHPIANNTTHTTTEGERK
jgi:AcrR family transcriptional regulator